MVNMRLSEIAEIYHRIVRFSVILGASQRRASVLGIRGQGLGREFVVFLNTQFDRVGAFTRCWVEI
jgi:hypothetical protein